MKASEIKSLPEVFENIHESCFKSYHILNKVLEMIERGDSKKTIFEFVEHLKDK